MTTTEERITQYQARYDQLEGQKTTALVAITRAKEQIRAQKSAIADLEREQQQLIGRAGLLNEMASEPATGEAEELARRVEELTQQIAAAKEGKPDAGLHMLPGGQDGKKSRGNGAATTDTPPASG